jgi:uncharacterized repeat protein (TIGR01451 family)
MNQAQLDGGGISLRDIGSVWLSNNEIDGNQALTGNGGALYLHNSLVTLNNNDMSTNQAEVDGGGIYAHSNSDLTIENDNTLANNIAVSGSGGGLYLNSGHATINDSTISGNSASIHGGGYYANNESTTLNRNTFSENEVQTGHGGGLYVKANQASLISNRIEQNSTANGRGGGLYVVEVNAMISQSHIIGNQAAFGGGIFFNSDDSIVGSNMIMGNSASRGGGVFLSNSSAKLKNNEFSTNIAEDGAALFLSESSDTILEDNQIFENVATSSGGGLYLELSHTTIHHNQIYSNTVAAVAQHNLEPSQKANNANYGGGLFLTESNARLEGNTIRANRADNGAALYLNNSAPSAINNIIAENQANTTASALYNVASSPIFLHNTIANNNGGDGIALFVTHDATTSSTLRMTNTILAGHLTALHVESDDMVILRGTLWHDNQSNVEGAGIINSSSEIVGSPNFSSTTTGDYRIALGSAAIDVALDVGIWQDIELEPRPTVPYQKNQSGFDIGADEYYHPDISLSYEAAPNPVIAGEWLTYTIHLENTGRVPLTATITATLPNQVSPPFIQTWSAITVTPEQPVWSQAFTATVIQAYTGSLESMVEVSSEQGASSSQMITSRAIDPTNEEIIPWHRAAQNKIAADEVLTYQLALTNTIDAALHATIFFSLPDGVTPPLTNTWSNILLSPNTTWLPPDPVTITIPVTYTGALTSTLQVSTQEGKLLNEHRRIVMVESRAPYLELRALTLASSPLTQVGEPIFYQLTMTNTGNTTLYTPTITISTTPSSAVLTSTFTIIGPSLSLSDTWSLTVPTTVTAEGYEMFTTTVVVEAHDSVIPEPIADHEVLSLEANVIQSSQSVTPNPAIPGALITYTVHVSNTSRFVTLTATIEDILPELVQLFPDSQDQWNISLPANAFWRSTITGTLASGCLSEPLTNIVQISTEQEVSDRNTDSVLALALSPTISARQSGKWDDSIWQDSITDTNQVPTAEDRVYIPKGITVTLPNEGISVYSLNNEGRLQSQLGKKIEIKSTTFFCNDGEIVVADLTTPTISSPDIELYAPTIENRGMITAGAAITDSVGGSLKLTGNLIINDGTLRAGDGADNAEGQGKMGGAIRILSPGGSIVLRESSLIESGKGGEGQTGGGDGGSLTLMTQNMSGHGEGEIWAGNGGHLSGNRAGKAGDGGTVKLFVNSQNPAIIPLPVHHIRSNDFSRSGETKKISLENQCLGEIDLEADIKGGDGGNATGSVTGTSGDGGDVYLMAPTVRLNNNTMKAGNAGVLTGTVMGKRGAIGISSGDSNCTSEPLLSLVGSNSKIKGEDITIFGGDELSIDMKNMSSNAISATGQLLLATGIGGRIDLRGNTDQVMAGRESVTFATNQLQLPTGLAIEDVAGNNANQSVARRLSGLSLVGQEYVVSQAGVPLTLTLTLINRSPQTDTFKLSATSGSSSALRLTETLIAASNQQQRFFVSITPNIVSEDIIEIRAISQNDITEKALLRIYLRQEGISELYLPLIHR